MGNSAKAIRETEAFSVVRLRGEVSRRSGRFRWGSLYGKGGGVAEKRWGSRRKGSDSSHTSPTATKALECIRTDRCCWQNGRDHCGNAAGMVRANVLAASTRRRAAMGKCIEIEAMKPVEIDHFLHAGKMVPRRRDRGSGKSGGGHSKGWSPFLLSEGQELFQM